MNITTLVDSVLKKITHQELPDIKENISSNLEFRLLFTLDMTKPFREAKKDFLRHYLQDLLVLSLGNVSLAARKAQLHRRHLHRMLNQFEIDASEHRKEMLKPQQYLQNNVQHIIEDTLAEFSDPKVHDLYTHVEDISQVVAENMGHTPYDEALRLFEKEYVEKYLKEHGYDIQKAASSMQISERTLYRKMNRLGIAAS